MSEKKPDKTYRSQLDKVKEITDKLEAGIQDLFESESFKNYLKTLSKFHDYSLNNTILIAMQKPDATLVAGYTAWQKNFSRQVLKGETGIRILAPTPYKKQMEVDRIDPATGRAILNPDGSTANDLKEVMIPAFMVVNVFDVSQTDGKPLPTIGVNELTGDVQQYEVFFNALKQACPVPIGFEMIDTGTKGYYHTVDHRIALQEGMSQVQTIKTLIHEMAHQKLHSIDPKDMPPDEPRLTRNAKEVEAEAVAYTVAQHYGIETSDYSFAYIAGWSHGKDTPELKASLDRIRKAADELIRDIDQQVLTICREKETEVAAQAEALAKKVETLAFDCNYFGNADAAEDRDASVQGLKDGLISGKTDPEGLILYLQGIADDEDYGSRAVGLIAEMKTFQGKLEDLQHITAMVPEPEQEPVLGLQENGRYRYYSTQRPVDLGTFPTPEGNAPVEFHNYDKRESVENGTMQAWGWLEYAKPLTEKEASDYELKPAPPAEKSREVSERTASPASEQKPSVLKELQETARKIKEKTAQAQCEISPQNTHKKEEVR